MGRFAGQILMAIGALHILLFLWWGRGPLSDVVRDGFFNAMGGPDHYRHDIFWSLCFGVMAVLLGQLINWSESQGKRTPAFLGWQMLGLSVIGAALMPVSGWWLVMVPAALIVVGAGRRQPT